MNALNVLCAQLTRDQFAIAKFLLICRIESNFGMSGGTPDVVTLFGFQQNQMTGFGDINRRKSTFS